MVEELLTSWIQTDVVIVLFEMQQPYMLLQLVWSTVPHRTAFVEAIKCFIFVVDGAMVTITISFPCEIFEAPFMFTRDFLRSSRKGSIRGKAIGDCIITARKAIEFRIPTAEKGELALAVKKNHLAVGLVLRN